MVDDAMVQKIQAAQKDMLRAQQRRDKLVRKAKENGATWTQIGYALGITAQGAQKRYGNTQERVDAYQENLRKRAAKRAARHSEGS
jgi:acetyl-CoA acetyltransferase